MDERQVVKCQGIKPKVEVRWKIRTREGETVPSFLPIKFEKELCRKARK